MSISRIDRPTSMSARRRGSGTRARMRRRRLIALVLLAAIVTIILVVATGGQKPTTTTAGETSVTKKAKVSIPAVESGVLPWSLSSALSREVVLAPGGTSLTVIGGLNANQTSSARIYGLDTTTGNEVNIGTLGMAVHDSAASIVRNQVLVFGGGSPNTIANNQQFQPPALPSTPTTVPSRTTHPPKRSHSSSRSTTTTTTEVTLPGPPGTVITSTTATSTAPQQLSVSVVGSLPQPRSDASAVTIGHTSYVVGGYDGSRADADVLATTDGVRFTTVATLPVPVRYGATVVDAGEIYVGHLPQRIAGASAFVLANHIYLAGGVGPAAGPAGTPSSEANSGLSTTPLSTVWAYDAKKKKAIVAGNLPVPTSYAGAAVVGNRAWLVGGESAGVPLTSVEMVEPNTKFGFAGAAGAGSPFYGGKLLVADRGNNRLLLLNDTDQVIWTYPSAYAAPPPGGFYFPDDAFFAKSGTEIISNQEENETIVIIAFPSGKVLWQYGHPGQTGSTAGYLHEPDDAYLLKNGQVTVADAQNCRVLFINPDSTVAKQIGTTNSCVHRPPDSMGSPNGDTPLLDGNVLVSEINGSWVSEYTPAGQLSWTVQLPLHYPSDPQQLGSDLYLISDYAQPGAIDEFNREGQLLYRYQPTSGLGRLNQPSLTELLPSGVFMTNDDYRDRMVAIDPPTGALVWQYGIPDTPGTAPGQLNIPDGFDLLLPDGSTPTHPATG
jgi:hypothetical protein